MFATTLVALALATSAFADPYITNPVGSTSWTGGQQATVNWQDDGKGSNLQAWGPCALYLDVGNAMQQTALQTIVPSVDVSTTQAVTFNVDPNAGANADEYFVRLESLGLKQGQYPALAFSAKFTLNGMKGTFNSTVQAQIDGQSTAPILGPPSSGSAGTPTATKAAANAVTSAAATVSASAKAAAANSATGLPAAGSAVALMSAALSVVLGAALL